MGQEVEKPGRGQLLRDRILDTLTGLQRQKVELRTRKAHPRVGQRSESAMRFLLEVLLTELDRVPGSQAKEKGDGKEEGAFCRAEFSANSESRKTEIGLQDLPWETSGSQSVPLGA